MTIQQIKFLRTTFITIPHGKLNVSSKLIGSILIASNGIVIQGHFITEALCDITLRPTTKNDFNT